MAELTPAEQSLLRATQLVWAAANLPGPGDDPSDDLAGVQLLGAARTLAWQAMVLLPEGLPLTGAQPARSGCLGALEEAEQELRSRPVGEYPIGTSALIVAICDTIAITRAGGWL